ncbi:hypothetical protein GM708_18240 [Vibrio cholerae]|nr:hypothetical protein [Vibrio cholerae]
MTALPATRGHTCDGGTTDGITDALPGGGTTAAARRLGRGARLLGPTA